MDESTLPSFTPAVTPLVSAARTATALMSELNAGRLDLDRLDGGVQLAARVADLSARLGSRVLKSCAGPLERLRDTAFRTHCTLLDLLELETVLRPPTIARVLDLNTRALEVATILDEVLSRDLVETAA